jgi:hypothetical protein
MPLTIEKPIFKPDISFDVKELIQEERSTIVHCRIFTDQLMFIRIWPTTFLIQDDGTRKSLLQAYNIASFPEWKPIFKDHVFTLVFEGLDKSCDTFDLLEDITESGAFHAPDIKRNKEDVYYVEFT